MPPPFYLVSSNVCFTRQIEISRHTSSGEDAILRLLRYMTVNPIVCSEEMFTVKNACAKFNIFFENGNPLYLHRECRIKANKSMGYHIIKRYVLKFCLKHHLQAISFHK